MTTALHEFLIPGTDPDIVARYETLAQRAKDASFGVLEDEYVVLDTETTGFSLRQDSLIEIAAAIMRGPHITERFSTFVDPGRAIPGFITELTGITNEDVQGAPDAWEATKALEDFVGTRQIVAHNAPFDRGFIAETAPVDSGLASEDRWIDSVELARIALPRLREHKLQTLSDAFGVHASTHRATDDVEALCSIWRILLVSISDLPPGLATVIAELFPQTPWPLREVLAQVAGSLGEAKFSLADARRTREGSQIQRQKIDAQELDGGIRALTPLDDAELEHAYSADGLLAQMYTSFEPRAEQLLMARELACALASQTHRAIEAGTGVGKSMAYLLPLALFAYRNQVTCGVATKTNALLDQLMYHELPRLAAALPKGVSYVAVKGYDHYPCLRKLMNLAREDRVFERTDAPATVAMLLSFVCQSARGDLDPLALYWRELSRHEICASAEDCLRHKCRFYQHCLLHGARRAAKKADIVLTNHALLFCDMEADRGILPPIRHWVIDEAHGAEAEARSQLSFCLEPRLLRQTLNGLLNASGALATMQRKATPLAGASPLLGRIAQTQEEARGVSAIAESFFSLVKDLCEIAEQSSYNQVELWLNKQVRDSGPWGMLVSAGSSLALRMEKLWQACRDIVSYSTQFEELLEVQGDLAGLAGELKEALESLTLILDGSNEDYVYYAELDRRADSPYDRLIAARIDIGAVLLERLYPETMSVIYTSATLAAGESFAYFARASGLDRLASERWRAVRFESCYDFEGNMAVYLPTDMPEPQARGYRDALEELIFAVHTALGGSTLTLFTNRRDMEDLYERLKGRLAQKDITLRCQSRGFSAKRLRDEFLENEALSLFALRSFWEGFDAPGDTLRCVIIPKLPFGKPNDPLMQERSRRESSAWKAYALPEAVIDLKQAAGRLIRSSTDSGSLVLADSRLLTKWYGRAFLDALPSHQHHALTTPDMVAALQRDARR
ncbi:MAG: DNA polymerase III subunit epsilon [Coriobacteriales bacterium]|jgi:ATP-dependent DNA helicase DinG|nr:DNA polymerase III subunit epsilon [Coriobacteriales bacterium]